MRRIMISVARYVNTADPLIVRIRLLTTCFKWLENRYAGCACDIPSVVYQFPWRPAKWSKYYSGSPEIWKYAKMVEQENNFVEKYVKLRHQVLQAEWSDEAGMWSLRVKNLETGEEFEDKVNVLLDGGGVLK